MNKIYKYISLLTVIIFSGIALFSIVPVSINTLRGINPCPSIALIPACYIVTICYTCIILSLFVKKNTLFYLGWAPVFLLALSGSTMEILGNEVCPRNITGIPLCYYSLIVSIIVFISYSVFKKYKTHQ